jgi:hypothetical protein
MLLDKLNLVGANNNINLNVNKNNKNETKYETNPRSKEKTLQKRK